MGLKQCLLLWQKRLGNNHILTVQAILKSRLVFIYNAGFSVKFVFDSCSCYLNPTRTIKYTKVIFILKTVSTLTQKSWVCNNKLTNLIQSLLEGD